MKGWSYWVGLMNISRFQWLTNVIALTFFFLRLYSQAVHWPLNVPQDDMFTKEQFQKLSAIKSNYTRRLEFAKIMYHLDLTVRGSKLPPLKIEKAGYRKHPPFSTNRGEK